MINWLHRNFYYCLSMLSLSALMLIMPGRLFSQGHLKAEVRHTNCSFENHEADRWYFGQNAGLDFRPQDPIADMTNFLMNVPTSPAVMADSLGNILFFTDGIRVWDRMGNQMPNGSGLHGFVGYTMPVLIVPKPESDSIYYIFTTYRPSQNPSDPQTIYGLEYNEVNLNRNGGLGDITIKNKVLLQPEVSSKLSAIRHNNGKDYWVVSHRFNSNEFCSFAVTSNGVDTSAYVSSAIGTVHTAPGETNNAIGFMKISPDGTKLAEAILGSAIYEIYDFDASTGRITNAIISSPVFNNAYGIEFSPDSRFLYGTCTPIPFPGTDTIPDTSFVFQFDISLGNAIFSSFDTIAIDLLGSYFGGIQLGTDGRIYVSRSPFGNAALSVIQNPKRPGAACNFAANALDLLGKKSRFGFPNFMQSYFDLPHFDVENVCFADTTIFTLQNNSNIDNVSWQFGDTIMSTNTSVAFQPDHVFSGPGSYNVQVTETYKGVSYGPYTETVIVNQLPYVNIGDTVFMYPGSPILLDAGEGFTSYEWSTGENSQVVKIDQAGTYWVIVQNELCCFSIDSVEVIYFNVRVPNAFRPDASDIRIKIFKAYASSDEAIRNFTLYVYNRWGQQVFECYDITQGWDGKIQGKDAPGDVYVWLITYDVEREGTTERITYKGNVILLR